MRMGLSGFVFGEFRQPSGVLPWLSEIVLTTSTDIALLAAAANLDRLRKALAALRADPPRCRRPKRNFSRRGHVHGIGKTAVCEINPVPLTELIVTKLDDTSKDGMVVTIQRELGQPIKLIGLGKQPEDLQPFAVKQFAQALFE